MAKVIIYEHNDETNVIVPSGDISVEETARKDVPADVDYWIVEQSTIPTDREFRNAWELDKSTLGTATGKGLGADEWFKEKGLA